MDIEEMKKSLLIILSYFLIKGKKIHQVNEK